jgi:uncharacterized iron-regulated membrane protein
MTTVQDRPVADDVVPTPPPSRPPTKGWFPQLLLRLHFLAGLFVGPFIVLAALSGAAYAAAPTIDAVVYSHDVTTASRGPAVSLAEQVGAAQRYIAAHHPGDRLIGLKPAAHVGATTQVMFSEPGLLDGQDRSVWIDPVTAHAQGDLKVYSTALPIATWVDFFHRTLFLGDVGSMYSELAASWLGIIALAGLGLWIVRIRKARAKRELVVPNSAARGYRRTFSWHAATGVWVLLAALFLSATGITWSLYAGGNVDAIRNGLDWRTPSLTTTMPHGGTSTDGSAQRDGRDLQLIDRMLAKGRSVNIENAMVEIDLPTTKDGAWVVQEIRRTYPTAVSSVAIDAGDMRVVSRTDWDRYPLVAKLIRWGIDTHMGLMWGLANQIVLFVAALGIASMVVFGYVMWWQRRPSRSTARFGRAPAAGALARAPRWGVAVVLAVSLLLGWLLPEVGIPLVGFVLVDTLLAPRRARAAAAARKVAAR